MSLPDDRYRRCSGSGWRQDVAHLCCNNGVELLSIQEPRAARCVGFDISDVAIGEGAGARWQTSTVNLCAAMCMPSPMTTTDLTGSISAGALGWLPDLARFFSRVAALLRTRGQVLIHEDPSRVRDAAL